LPACSLRAWPWPSSQPLHHDIGHDEQRQHEQQPKTAGGEKVPAHLNTI
jgi:hypothetical protein